MKNLQLLTLLKESRLSPERLAKRLNVSNMSVRRLMKRSPDDELPENLAKALDACVNQMIIDGLLTRESKSASRVLRQRPGLELKAALKGLGMTGDFSKWKGTPNEKLAKGLSEIGAAGTNQSQVDKNFKKIGAFQKWGEDWSQRIGVLTQVVRSNKLSATDKLVAYGALFYLIWPFDLIPDNIPVIGYLDDYAILGLAAAYYLKKYSDLLNKEIKKS